MNKKLKSDSKKKDKDSICKLAVKRMLERIRKKTRYQRIRKENRITYKPNP